MADPCAFCDIAAGRAAASLICADMHALAFVDLRQFHPGHTLVVPRRHFADLRELDDETGAALMAMLVRVTRAVDAAFPNQGLSLWHSIGPAAHQEVPHLHIHVHPRVLGDGFLRVYPDAPRNAGRQDLEAYAERIRLKL